MEEISFGKKYKLYDLIIQLEESGYQKAEKVAEPGEYKLIGDLLTIYPTNSLGVCKISFFGDQVESITSTVNEKTTQVSSIIIDENILRFPNGTKVKPDDYVVHIDHGVGIFRRIGLKKIGEVFKPYIFIAYLNDDYLYVPLREIDRVSPYVGVGRRKPKLNKLGSITWQRTKQRIYESALKLAKELLAIYAKRELIKKPAYNIDKIIEKEALKTFPYTETPDQKKALNDIYLDLSSMKPMDRLICGDVGYGKTEVALRAALQAVANGYQVAYLCPTTILTEQHFATFTKRLEHTGVNIAKLSRFLSKEDMENTVKSISSGSTDIAIGTHRLLSSDVRFKSLDLVIIDEEQRFGVKQKEKFKKLSEKLNVLILSATPIPRTLYFSLSGIRDISEINTPPRGRKSIETKIAKFNDSDIVEFADRELKRGGQIYYLHNRVETIIPTREKLQRMLPKAKIQIAHGQMSEEDLANTMAEFAKGDVDILVCSTIIENGLDLPNVNTLIIEEADRFGLSQLYQIRGRIGRSDRQAYSLFTYKKELSVNAFKRLQSLAENTELGSGFNIAMSDLEIRGGGNILGREQHGNMEAVGLVLYSKLLKQAVLKIES
ncbi:MAG: DEAD/DEAH box helicase [Patescibacteria group bacterium]